MINFRLKAFITLVFGLILSIILSNGALALERTSGKDRYETAVKISQLGWEKADTVVLATGKDFPDSLAGGPLAYKYDAPILLTGTKALSTVTRDEIVRLQAKDVIILGGLSAVSSEVEKEVKALGVSVNRISGANRFETAARISEELPSSQAVVINGRNFPDALSISSYAAMSGIPILLTEKDKLPSATRDRLDKVGGALVMGGEGVISQKVFEELPTPYRVGGTNRFDTNRISVKSLQTFEGWSDKAVIATGKNFADALAGSVYAAKNAAPIILVEKGKIPSQVAPLLEDFHDFTVLGGEAAISESVIQNISSHHNPFPDVSNPDDPMFSKIGEPVVFPDNRMTVTVDKIVIDDTDPWLNKVLVTYTQENETVYYTLVGGSLELYYADGSKAYHYDLFQYDTLQPGESRQRTHTFTVDKSEMPVLLEYGVDLYENERPAKNSLKWIVQ